MKFYKYLAALSLLLPFSQGAKADLCMDPTTHGYVTCPASDRTAALASPVITGTVTGSAFSTMTQTPAGSWAGIHDLNSITATSGGINDTTGQYTNALAIYFNLIAGDIGSFQAYDGTVHQTAATGNASVNGNYTGGRFTGIISANDNGDSGTYRGNAYGINPRCIIGASATFIKGCIGEEIDVEVNSGSSVYERIGIQVVDTNTVVGATAPATVDIGYSLNDSFTVASTKNVGWKMGLGFGSYDGYFPFNSTSTMIGCWTHAASDGTGNCGTTLNGVDFSNVTFTGNAFKSNGYAVDGSGNVTANSVSAGGTLYGGIPFLLGGGASTSMGNNGALTGLTAIPATLTDAYVFAPPGSIGNATAASVTITGTAGQFACTCTGLAVGQYMALSGTYGGTGSITGYADPTIYYVSATNGTSTFTLQSSIHSAIVTTAGTPTGITYKAGGGWFYGIGSSTSAFTLYNNMYITGTPTVPSSPTAFSTTGVGSFTQTTGFIIPAVATTIAANSLAVTGELDVEDALIFTNSANTKTTQIQVNATSADGQTYTTSATGLNEVKINPSGITSKAISSFQNWVATNNTVGSMQGPFAIDTTVSQRVQIVMELNTAAAEYMMLRRYSFLQH